MERILISACLLGAPVRHHGGHAKSGHALLDRWAEEGRLVPVCPEVLGGLPTPRPAAELQRRPSSGSFSVVLVVDRHGSDVTEQFQRGAAAAVREVDTHDIRMAILKDGSPSCGTSSIYDGSFSGRLTAGQGVTASLLAARGVRLFSENEIAAAASYLAQLEHTSSRRIVK
jgi:uncharacterized protein YbbK (DUF523 family)